jgi:hypothetical protein
MKKLISIFKLSILSLTILTGCGGSSEQVVSNDENTQQQEIEIDFIKYKLTKDFEIKNFSIANSFIVESVLKDGKDQFFIVYTFDIVNNSGEDVFEKRINIEKAKELGMSEALFRISQNNQFAEFSLFGKVLISDINNIKGKESYYNSAIILYNDKKEIVKFNSMNPLKNNQVIHGLGFIKFSNMMNTSTDLNIDLIKNDIAFQPKLYIEIDGGTASDFGKYHDVIATGNTDISNIKTISIEAIKNKKNFISMDNSKWYKSDYDKMLGLLNIK